VEVGEVLVTGVKDLASQVHHIFVLRLQVLVFLSELVSKLLNKSLLLIKCFGEFSELEVSLVPQRF